MSARRMLLVHAHPDDESITTGAVMAKYAGEGVEVTLLTCTLGEEGEILLPALAELAAGRGDQLGGYRMGELDGAMRALGVTDHRYLGGAGRFRDSGMMGAPSNGHPRAFWRAWTEADVFAEAVALAVEVIRDVRPQVVLTYDENGDYGHPDHIMANRVTTAAIERAADPGYGDGAVWEVSKLYWTATPTSVLARELAAVRANRELPFEDAVVEQLPFGVDDSTVTAAIGVGEFVEAKLAALEAHRTQVVVQRPFYALSNMIGRLVGPTEYFRLRRGTPGTERDADGRECDLFAGLAGEVP